MTVNVNYCYLTERSAVVMCSGMRYSGAIAHKFEKVVYLTHTIFSNKRDSMTLAVKDVFGRVLAFLKGNFGYLFHFPKNSVFSILL